LSFGGQISTTNDPLSSYVISSGVRTPRARTAGITAASLRRSSPKAADRGIRNTSSCPSAKV
jgi:hypothetical protein